MKDETPAWASAPPRFQNRFLHPRYWPAWLALGLLLCLSLLPDGARRSLGARLGDLAYNLNAKRRRIARINLKLCFPEKEEIGRKRLLREHFRGLGAGLMDYALLWFGSDARLAAAIDLEGEEHLRRCREQGRNVILITGHSIALEFGPMALARRYPLVGPYKAAKNALVDWRITRGRLRFGGYAFERGAGMLGYARALKQGHVLFTLSDEDLGTRHSVFAPFFDQTKATLPTIGRLAALANAVVIPCMSFYDAEHGRYRVVLDPPLEDFPSGDAERDAACTNRALERLIWRCPEQYMWTFKWFRTRPAGAQSIYRR